MRRKMIFGLMAVFCLAFVGGCAGGGLESSALSTPEMDHMAAADPEKAEGGQTNALSPQTDGVAAAQGETYSEKEKSGGTNRDSASTGETRTGAANLIGEKAARAAALKHAGLAESGVSRLGVELDREDGRLVYEVEFYAGEREYDYEIDARTGDVLSYEYEVKRAAAEGGNRPETSKPAGAANLIGEKAARAAALKHAGLAESGVSRLGVELDREDGRLVYEIEFYAGEREYDYEIDARTGDVLSYDVESSR